MKTGIYEKKLRLLSSDVDIDRRLRTSVLFSMFQEAAIAHTEQLGMGREKTLDKGLLWIVTLQSLEIDRMPCYDEDLVLRSWPGDTMHLLFPRYYSMESADGETLLRASSLWSLLDAETRGIVFPEKHGIAIKGVKTGDEISLPSAPRSIPASASRELTVPYSMTDLNGHLNNTRYFDLAEDAVYKESRGLALRSVKAEFSREIRLGETFTLSTGRDGGRFYVSGIKNAADSPSARGEVCFRMSLEYA